MNVVSAFTFEREKRMVAESRDLRRPTMPRFERIGAAAMVKVGSILDLLNADKTLTDHISPLERHAYGNTKTASRTRKLYASIFTVGLVGLGAVTGIGINKLVDETADAFACSDETHQLSLLEGGTIRSNLSSEVPHANLDIADVDKVIADLNPDLVSVNSSNDLDPDLARPGIYKVPVECNSSH